MPFPMNNLYGMVWEAETGEGSGVSPSAVSAAPAEVEAPAATEAPAPASAEGGEGGETFDLSAVKLPEGLTLTEEDQTALTELFSKPDLSRQDLSQSLLNLYAERMAAQAAAQQESNVATWNELNEKWQKELAELPEFKADQAAALGSIKQALLAQGADEAFFSAMDLTGAGNHPQILQMLYKLTRPFTEGGMVGGGNSPKAQRSAAELMYPSMAKE